MICPLILSAALAAPTPQTSSASEYRCFRDLDFPQPAEWRSLQELQDISRATLSQGNSPETVQQIFDEVNSVAGEADIDP